jgi:hypothetical protein
MPLKPINPTLEEIQALDAAGDALIVFDVANSVLSPSPDTAIVGGVLKAGSKAALNKHLRNEAKRHGFTTRIAPQKAPFDSHGQPVFSNGKRFLTPDVDSHKGGVWKMFDRRGNRLGTFDADLNRIGN